MPTFRFAASAASKESSLHDTHYPAWWNPAHTSTWETVKESLRRDWEQTRHDLSGGRYGQDLNQQVANTVRQIAGTQPIPPAGVPNPPAPAATPEEPADPANLATDLSARWHSSEAPLRYGYLSTLRRGEEWTPQVEEDLRGEWTQLAPDRAWEEVEPDVHYAWERAARRDQP